MKLRKPILCGLAVLTALGASACGSDSGGSDDGPIKIGLIAPLSGAQPDRGKILKASATLAVEDINKEGGIDGRDLELVVVDDANDTNQSVSAAQRLIQRENVTAITGIISSTSFAAIQPIARRTDTVMMGSLATASGLTDGEPLSFRSTGSNDTIGPQIADLALARGGKKVGVVHDDTTYAKDISAATVEAVPEGGGEVVVNEEYQVGAADVTPQITKVQNSGADTVIPLPITGADMALLARTLVESDMKVPIFSHNGIFTSEALKLGSKFYDQLPLVMGMGTIDLTRPEVAEFYQRMNDAAGFDVPQNEDAGQTYDAIQLLAEGLRESKGEGGEALAKAIEGIDKYVGMAGAKGSYYSFSPEKHTGLTGDYMVSYEYKDGEFVVVED